MKRLRSRSAVAIVAAFASFASDAHAQKPIFGAFMEGASGISVGGGNGFLVLQRARTLARVGGWLSFDESPNQVYSVALLMSVEPSIAIGADAQWGYWLSKMFLFEAGPTMFFAPQTLIGITGGLRARVPLDSHFAILAGMSFSAYFAGSDLPANTAVLSALGVVGIHATF
jgi:hypothetical protein